MRKIGRFGLGILSIVIIALSGNLPTRVGAGTFPTGKQILLVEDPACGTWGSTSLTMLGITTFTVVSPSQFATVNLNLYDVLYVGNLPLDLLACRNIVASLVGRSADIATWAQSTIVSCQDPSTHFSTNLGGAAAARTLLSNMLSFAAGSGHSILAEVESFISIPPSNSTTPYQWLPRPLVSRSASEGASGNFTHIVLPSPVTQGLSDTDLSNWSLSFHCQFSSSSQYTTLVQGTSLALGTLPIIIAAGILQARAPGLVGRVCLVPGESTTCPQNLQPITGSPSGSLNVSVNILGSAGFNSLNMSIKWDSTVVNATAIDTAGTILPSPTIVTSCLHSTGLGCGPSDGPAIAHLAMTGSNTTAPASGRLFKLKFVFGTAGGEVRIGYRTDCSASSIPNTSVCILVAMGLQPVAEEIQSQLLGTQLPSPFQPGGSISGNFTLGAEPNFADTYVTPYIVSLPGTIKAWKTQFLGGLLSNGVAIPAGVQIKVLRKISPTILSVVAAGPVHDPRPVLQQRIPTYPLFSTESSVIEFYTDPELPVLPGDQIGLTVLSNATVGHYAYPYVNRTDTRIFGQNVPVNGTIDLNTCVPNPFPPPACLPLPRLPFSPAIQVFIRVRPPANDTAGDGIPDYVKLTPEFQALGADPCRKTIAVQMDYMVRPSQQAIDGVINSFDQAPVNATLPCPYPGFPSKATGIKLIIDVRNQVPFQTVLNFTHSAPQSFDGVKAAFLDPNRIDYFHYGIFAHSLAPLGTRESTISGAGELFGSNFLLTLGEWPGGGTVPEQEGTIMHEIGHNLGLGHGGSDKVNFKPNYLSVMNYAFQVVGITRETSSGNVTRFDYSHEALSALNESSLQETTPLSNSNDITRWACPDGHHVNFGLVSGPLDWNCNNQPDTAPVKVDLNNDTRFDTLTGFNDWASLRYKFSQSASYGTGCAVDCEIGCAVDCEIGTELIYPVAAVIEAQTAAFLATPHHPTSSAVSCTPSSVSTNTPSLCTGTIMDTSTTMRTTPTGIISFKTSAAGSFGPADNCSIGGTGASASCSVTYTPAIGSLGSQTISVAYVGDTAHFGSTASTTINGVPPLLVSKFFTDGDLNPLPVDKNGTPKIDVLLSHNIVQSTNPGEIIAWVKVTDTAGSIVSLKLNETLPVDWTVHPFWLPAKGGIRVFFTNTTNLMAIQDITIPSMITEVSGNPETVQIVVPNVNQTMIGHPLLSGQSILLGVKLKYGLIGTTQSPASYPITYPDTAVAMGWTLTSFTGTIVGSSTAKGSFIAYAKVAGDVDNDGHVDIGDLAQVGAAFGSRVGGPNYNAAADFAKKGFVDITDFAIVAANFGS